MPIKHQGRRRRPCCRPWRGVGQPQWTPCASGSSWPGGDIDAGRSAWRVGQPGM